LPDANRRSASRSLALETWVPRLLTWLLILIVLVVVLAALGLMLVEVPYQPTRVEQPVSNETLGL
jgi:hypothetical protein